MSVQLFCSWPNWRSFWRGQAYIYPVNYLLHVRLMLTFIKCSSFSSHSACGNREHPGNFQNKSVNSPFNWVPRYILFLAKLKTRGRSFLEVAWTGAGLWDYSQERLVVTKSEKVCTFLKFEIILSFLCCLLDPFTNRHCRAWSSMISLWIDCRTCQKYRTLLSARQRSNNYLKLSKENVLGNMMLLHWPCFTWKFFMTWFTRILKLIYQKQPSCPRNICTEHWTKPPIFTAFLEIFLYLSKNNDPVEHV